MPIGEKQIVLRLFVAIILCPAWGAPITSYSQTCEDAIEIEWNSHLLSKIDVDADHRGDFGLVVQISGNDFFRSGARLTSLWQTWTIIPCHDTSQLANRNDGHPLFAAGDTISIASNLIHWGSESLEIAKRYSYAGPDTAYSKWQDVPTEPPMRYSGVSTLTDSKKRVGWIQLTVDTTRDAASDVVTIGGYHLEEAQKKSVIAGEK